MEVESGQNEHVVFIKGETIDLCVPSEKAIEDGWYSWFNDPGTTQYLLHGYFPNTVEKQREFLQRALEDTDRLVLLVKPKQESKVTGVVSLSSIDLFRRTTEIALVMEFRPRKSNVHALEAMARITEHGFETLGLEVIYGGQEN